MALKIVSFLAIAFTALALVPYGAHLFSLPNKIGMSQTDYFVAQRAYDNWWLVSLVLFPAMAFNITLAVMLRGDHPAFPLAVAGCVVMASTLAIFFAFTQPGNAATQNWTIAPENWRELRTRWEYSHAANAFITFLSFCLMTLAVIFSRRSAA